jgi:hypothetical protein
MAKCRWALSGTKVKMKGYGVCLSIIKSLLGYFERSCQLFIHHLIAAGKSTATNAANAGPGG